MAARMPEVLNSSFHFQGSPRPFLDSEARVFERVGRFWISSLRFGLGLNFHSPHHELHKAMLTAIVPTLSYIPSSRLGSPRP